MRKFIKFIVPAIFLTGLFIGIQIKNTTNANPPPAPTQTTIFATGFGTEDGVRLSIFGVPEDCLTCWRGSYDDFVPPGSTISFGTGEKYIDTRNTAYDEGSIYVYYKDGSSWNFVGWYDIHDYITGTTNGWITGITIDVDDMNPAEEPEE